jgi:hypothetical protein
MKTFSTLLVVTLIASALPAQQPVPKPKSAAVVDIPPAEAELGIKAGNIQVMFTDGHSDNVTKNGNCMKPHVSDKGNMGWTQCTNFDRKGYAMNEKLVIKLVSGGTKEFRPNPSAPFIEDWSFTDNDSAIVIKSRGAHGPASFVRYDLATGRMTQKKDGRSDAEKAPSWAQLLSND